MSDKSFFQKLVKSLELAVEVASTKNKDNVKKQGSRDDKEVSREGVR